MKKEILKDNKNMLVKIMCSTSNALYGSVYAGENGSIRLGKKYLTPMLDQDNFLAEIIDVRFTGTGDIISLSNTNMIYLYKKTNDYKAYKIDPLIRDDFIINITSAINGQIILSSEKGLYYKITYDKSF
jgi:hypothetical protein